MQVILLENIKKLGSIGQKVNVKDGYARNYLLKNKKALLANKKNLEFFEKQKEEINKKKESKIVLSFFLPFIDYYLTPLFLQ